ncbi:DoxX family protein [Nocardioides anomalus]|uniref:DoxX family protein n=1 Tax=Nocardioides anomalus TaxID=2712223 RepID=A0A6G6WFL4_9ACTN|nr:DoxX family protein [Nocardioides anomalus]QIG43885.1 DoxX family protein [Nocardioides anomalus]
MAISRLLARPMLASMFIVGGLDSVRNARTKAEAARPVTDRVAPLLQRAVPQLPSDPASLVRLNGGVQVAAGLALATGRFPRLSAAVLAASLVPTTAAGHRFWEASDPAQKAQQRVHFFKNVSMLGGLIIASGDTEGQPGVVWRTRRAAKDARREAKVLARSARREAALAKAKVT